MRLWEFVDAETQKLYALSKFLLGEHQRKPISIPSFIALARSMGLNINDDQLRDIATKPPLNDIIVNVTDDQVIFAGSGQSTEVTDKMTVTQAQDTVKKMANRALPKKLK